MHLSPTSKLGYLSLKLSDMFPHDAVRWQTYGRVTGAYKVMQAFVQNQKVGNTVGR